jgi:hypothetical protein
MLSVPTAELRKEYEVIELGKERKFANNSFENNASLLQYHSTLL